MPLDAVRLDTPTSRVRARRQLVPRPTDLNGVLTGMQRLWRPALTGRRIEMQLDAGLEPVLVDTEQMGQPMLNLTTNARDAMSNGGCRRD